METTGFRDSILLIGASGQTGRYVLRYLCAAAVPVIACVRSAERLASDPSLASAEVAVANVEQPHTLAPLIERAAHVIYLVDKEITPFDEAKLNLVEPEAATKAFQAWLEERAKDVGVEVDPRYGTFDPSTFSVEAARSTDPDAPEPSASA